MGCGASVPQDGEVGSVNGEEPEKKSGSVASLAKALSRQSSKAAKEDPNKEPLPPVTIFFSCESKHHKQVKELGELILEKSKTDQNEVKSAFSFAVGCIDRENYTVDDRIGRSQLYVPIVTTEYIRQHQMKRRGERQQLSHDGPRALPIVFSKLFDSKNTKGDFDTLVKEYPRNAKVEVLDSIEVISSARTSSFLISSIIN